MFAVLENSISQLFCEKEAKQISDYFMILIETKRYQTEQNSNRYAVLIC
jgi:hypothetical protein